MLKVRLNSTHLFRWDAPEPVVASDPNAPTLVVRRAGAVIDGIDALEPVVAPQTITSINADRRRLTLASPLEAGAADRAAGPEWGGAWLLTGSDGVFAVRVSGISTVEGVTVVTLASPLPRMPAGGSGVLQWSAWTTVLAPETVTGQASRAVTWAVTWVPVHAGGVDATTQRVDEGRLLVVRRPFSTGLTPERLASLFPELGQTVASIDNSRRGAIDRAEGELVLDLRPHVRARGVWEDDVDGEVLQLAAATLTASIIVEPTQPERAKALRERYNELLERGLRALWVDDGDGVPEEGEDSTGPTTTVALAPGLMSNLFPSALSPAPRSPRYYRGRPH